MDKFVENYKCKCDKKTIFPFGKIYCKHLLSEYKRKFNPKILKIIRKEIEEVKERVSSHN